MNDFNDEFKKAQNRVNIFVEIMMLLGIICMALSCIMLLIAYIWIVL
jgi:hypothetical protein